jgi:hypothetical protein
MPNQAKKHRKNANHDMWTARIWGMPNLKKLPQSADALFCISINYLPWHIIGYAFPAPEGSSRRERAELPAYMPTARTRTVVDLLYTLATTVRFLANQPLANYARVVPNNPIGELALLQCPQILWPHRQMQQA